MSALPGDGVAARAVRRTGDRPGGRPWGTDYFGATRRSLGDHPVPGCR